jgi:ribose transport system ATP-binding protein
LTSSGATSAALDDAAAAGAALRIERLSKSYGATVALRDVSLDVRAGEIHALLGENGAGKSTLVKILNGIVLPDGGSVELGGRPFRPGSVMDARACGVATAFQELSLLPNLSVATNLLLPRLPHGFAGFGSQRATEEQAASTLRALDAGDIDPRTPVAALSLARRQQIEILRAVRQRPRLLVLDEPTAALAHPQWLFRRLEELAAADTAILYITHRIADVRRLCARATVLRNGVKVDTVQVARTSDASFFEMMVGAGQPARATAERRQGDGPPRLAARGLGGRAIDAIDFELRPGEILGVAGLEGQGQRELFRMLSGAARAARGTIVVDGRAVTLASPAAAQRAGIGAIPEDRKTEGIFAGLSTLANVSLPILDRLRRLLLLDSARERAAVGARAAQVDLAERSLPMDVADLSGGNQQKALLARVLITDARALVLFDPTRGVDVGTKRIIYELMRGFAAAGGSVIVYSSELTELVELADRCIVLYRGRIAGEVAGDELTEPALIALATGTSLVARDGIDASAPVSTFSRATAALGNGTAIAFYLYAALLLFCALRLPGTLTVTGITDLLNNALPLAVAAAGASVVVLTRNFDLSVAGVVALTNVLIATVIPEGTRGALEGALLAAVVGLAIGAANGLFVTYLGLQSVATTLGTTIVCSGIALLVLDAPGGAVPHAISDTLTGDLGVVPVAAIVAAAVALAWVFARRTDWGIALYAVGADETAAQLAGIRTRRTTFWAFCVAGVLYGLAGYLLSAVTTTGDPNAGTSYLILTYAAVAIGGVSFNGGYGGVIGGMIGAATLSVLQKVLFSLGVVSFYTGIAQGIAMIAAVLLGGLSARLTVREAE